MIKAGRCVFGDGHQAYLSAERLELGRKGQCENHSVITVLSFLVQRILLQ